MFIELVAATVRCSNRYLVDPGPKFDVSGNFGLQGGSAHALIFSWACWSGIWPRMDARRRRLAGLNGLKSPKSEHKNPPGGT